jgi:predicted HTH domain antitoxin
MVLQIPDEVLLEQQFSVEELKTELAIALFQQDRLSLSLAAKLAGLPRLAFQRLLASREIPIHYSVPDWGEDLQVVDELMGR